MINKTDPFTFDRFIDNIQNQEIYELKIDENFKEFITAMIHNQNQCQRRSQAYKLMNLLKDIPNFHQL